MAWTYDQLIAEIHLNHQTASGYLATANSYFSSAQIDWTAGNDHAAIYSIMWGMYYNSRCIGEILGGGYYGYNGSSFIIPTALDRNMACPFITDAPPYDLTMQKIIDTMWTSNPLEAFFFVNYIDGMRASIWNLEIQETHLRDIYNHFLSWE